MATSSSILSYIDNVVSSYDAASTESKYTNLKVNNDAELLNVDVSGKAVIDTLNIVAPPGEYRLPSTSPNSGDYIAYGGVTNTDGSKQLEFKYFNSSSVTIHTLGDLLLHPSRSDGTIVHVANGTSILAADTATEYKVIDNKPPVLPTDISLGDRLLVSVSRPGSTVPDLNKMTLRNLLDFIEKENPGTSAIKYLTSNTEVDANQHDVTVTIDDGSATERKSTFANTGLTLHGDIHFINDLDLNSSNAKMEVLSSGYKLTRYANTLDFLFEGSQNLILKSNELQAGTLLTLTNNAYIDMLDNSFIEAGIDSGISLDSNSMFILNVDSNLEVATNSSVEFTNTNHVYSFDQSVTTTSDVDFNQLYINDTTDATGVGSAPLTAFGGASVGATLFVGNTVHAYNEVIATTNVRGFNVIALNDVTTPMLSATDINATANVDSAVVNTGFINVGNISAVGNIDAGNDIFAANAIFSSGSIVTSSIAYKENINTFNNGLNYIMNMNPVSFDRKNTISKNEIGFIAEEMETILPNVVRTGHGVKGIQYDQIIPVLVSAIQQQQKKIDELENKIK